MIPRTLHRLIVRLPALGLALLLGAGTAQAVDDEMVPAGVVGVRLTHTRDTVTKGITRQNKSAPLKDYLITDLILRDLVSGTVEREVVRMELGLTFGLTDTWNLVLQVPQVEVAQTSTLTTDSSDPAVQAELERLESRTISGLGRVRLGSQHRPVFSDRHGFVWGYGVDVPGEDPATEWQGRGTLLLDSPFRRVYALAHYTYYPFFTRARLDLRLGAGRVLEDDLRVAADGTTAQVDPGDEYSVSLDWQQEIGPVTAGLGVRLYRQSNTVLDAVPQDDKVLDHTYRLRLGYGNLRALEEAPIAFPYLLLLSYEETWQGYNTPVRNELSLSLNTYF